MKFSDYRYVPILGVKPSEMTALEELPPQTKNNILPYIVLQPWLTAHHLANTIAKVECAFNERQTIVDICPPQASPSNSRPVHDALSALRDPSNGYHNWYNFIEENKYFIPSLQLTNLNELETQVSRLSDLDRGIVVRLHEPMLPYAGDIASRMAGKINSEKVYFILDYEKQNRDILIKTMSAISAIRGIRNSLQNSTVSVSATSFPDTFVGLSRQDIFERSFHTSVETQINSENIIYCDHGSVRVEKKRGGGGTPAPRIDLASTDCWNFFRVDDADDKVEGYQTAASQAINHASWCDHGIWGTEFIKRTADISETNIINSPAKSTTARINIHLHVQAYHDSAPPTAATDVEWCE